MLRIHHDGSRAELVGTPPLKTCFEGGMWWDALVLRPEGICRRSHATFDLRREVAFQLALRLRSRDDLQSRGFTAVVLARSGSERHLSKLVLKVACGGMHWSCVRKGYVGDDMPPSTYVERWRSGSLRDCAVVVLSGVSHSSTLRPAGDGRNDMPPSTYVERWRSGSLRDCDVVVLSGVSHSSTLHPAGGGRDDMPPSRAYRRSSC